MLFLSHSVIRKVSKIGMKVDYENNDSLRTAVRCLPALAVVHSLDIIGTFLTAELYVKAFVLI